jgi:peroxiredoxin|tara:strand:+ start:3793 stop:4401 length:609 start_codon:yes stop_codon:yes gene_type:complete
MAVEMTVPLVQFNRRGIPEGRVDFDWISEDSEDIFGGKRVVLFALPGAFTPTCSSTHLPGYEANYDEIIEQDVDEVYVLSVNDSFVMNAWLDGLSIQKVKPIADGNGDFSRNMGMLVKKEAVNFGLRSHRYSMVVDNGLIEMIFVEQGKEDNFAGDPFDVSDATSMLNYLTNIKDVRREAIQDAKTRAEEEALNDTETSTPE